MIEFRTPKIVSGTEVYQQAHAAVLNNPYWYSNRPHVLSETFNAENTQKRADIVIDILRRAARRRTERHLSPQYLSLADKLAACRLDRCGSSACLECLRAFQQAKTVAHRRVISKLATKYSGTLWCVVTIVPLELNYPHGTLHEFNAGEFNHHLNETLTWDRLDQTIFRQHRLQPRNDQASENTGNRTGIFPCIPVIRNCFVNASKIYFRLW